ncbi:unnamed protein product [Penicillium egyptiacum]|uniref:Cytochrome P450 n=1 Tax=Penicillium egyptiacum TaxID=1303716 RepID=A0A9W4K9R2_9EURO|nr:unnamed protein product [Penicillium egyptiacum]
MLIPTLWAAISGVLCYGLLRLRFLRNTQYAHLPGPPTSLLWGHLKVIAQIIWPNPAKHFVLLDLRPAFYPIAVIHSHELAEQISKATTEFRYSVPKAPLQEVIGHVIGSNSFLMSNGEKWKHTRKAFNVGFAPTHLATFIPQILEKVQIFLQGLDVYAESGKEFNLGERCTLLTFDVIGRAILDINLNSQGKDSEQHEVVRCFRELLANLSFWPQLEWLISPSNYSRRMELTNTIDTSLRSIARDKFDKLHSDKSETSDRSVLSLSLKSIDSLDSQAMQESIDSIRTFLFAGYDTTSVVLQWAFYELSRTPRALTALREELDRILGPNAEPSAIADAILSDVGKVNQLSYLSAVIKETLRLHPPAGTSRFVPPGTNFRLQTNKGPLCVDGIILYINHFSIQRDRTVHGESAEAWIPERWLESRDESIPASSWRPFERGPRNCIGQELVNLEARLVLAMTARRYDITKVGIGAPVLMSDGVANVDEWGQYLITEPLYDTFNMSAKPVDGTMVTVRYRQQNESIGN